MKKILVITPKLPFPKTGADEQDRGSGIESLVRLGYEVRVIAKTSPERMLIGVEEARRAGASLTAVPYLHSTFKSQGLSGMTRRIFSPWTWDGAANEYYDPVMQEAVRKELDAFMPDLVWFDYTYLWPLYSMVRKRGIPIITRSINFEPAHFLGEDGLSLMNLLKYLPKLASEYITVKKSDLILSITPWEEATYKRLGARVRNLPLRGLPSPLVEKREIAEHHPIDAFFMGSTYNVSHNRHALEFLLREVVPRVNAKAPGRFRFHILGSKMPAELGALCVGNVSSEGYVEDLDGFLAGMDVAVMPSLIGARGMQGKIFEPLAKGIPMVASPRAIAGYPIVPRRDYLAAETADDFVNGLMSLEDVEARREMSANALKVSHKLFSREAIDAIIVESIESLTKGRTTSA